MYLFSAAHPSVRNKWGMGRMAGLSTSASRWRMGRLGMVARRLRGLGDDPSFMPYDTTLIDPSTQQQPPLVLMPSSAYPTRGELTPSTSALPGILNLPGTYSTQNQSPTAGGGSNGGITTAPAGTPSQNPLDYVSPQAAIAAGLNSQTVYNAWSGSLSKFPSPQAAIAAGVPAGVVNQLWQQAHVAPPPASSTIFGIPTTPLLIAGGALLLLPLLGKGRR
jgi:hypothetical protein